MFRVRHAEHGGELQIETGYSLDLQGSLLVNNGTINGATEVYYGATAKGGGPWAVQVCTLLSHDDPAQRQLLIVGRQDG